MAVGNKGTHATRLSERQRLAIMSLAARGIEPVGMACNVAEEMQRMRRKTRLMRRGVDRAIAQALRLVEPAKEQASSTQRL